MGFRLKQPRKPNLFPSSSLSGKNPTIIILGIVAPEKQNRHAMKGPATKSKNIFNIAMGTPWDQSIFSPPHLRYMVIENISPYTNIDIEVIF